MSTLLVLVQVYFPINQEFKTSSALTNVLIAKKIHAKLCADVGIKGETPPLRCDHIALLTQWLPGFYEFQFNMLSSVYHLFLKDLSGGTLSVRAVPASRCSHKHRGQ